MGTGLKKERNDPLLFLACRKRPSAFSASFLQSAARTPCAPLAHNSHTCSLKCVFVHVHAAAKNDLDFIRCLCSELCEAFLTDWKEAVCGQPLLNAKFKMQNGRVRFAHIFESFPEEIPQFCILHSELRVALVIIYRPHRENRETLSDFLKNSSCQMHKRVL